MENNPSGMGVIEKLSKAAVQSPTFYSYSRDQATFRTAHWTLTCYDYAIH